MKNSLDRSEFEKAMIATQGKAEVICDRVNVIIQERWIDDKDYGQIQAVSREVIAEMDKPVTKPTEKIDYVELWQRLGYSSLVKLSDNICLASKSEKHTITDNSGKPLLLELPGKPPKVHWFNYCYKNGNGVIFQNTFGPFWTRKWAFRFSNLDGSYTGIRDLNENDLGPKVVEIWSDKKGRGIYIKDWVSIVDHDYLFWNINERWVLLWNMRIGDIDN